MKVLFSVIAIVLFFYSCNSVDPDSSPNLSIKTEKASYIVDSTMFVVTTFANYLGKEIQIYNSGCGGPSFTLEKYDGKIWSLFGELPICERIPAEPIKLGNGNQIEVAVNTALITNVVPGQYRMKFHITESTSNTVIDDKYLYSIPFNFTH